MCRVVGGSRDSKSIQGLCDDSNCKEIVAEEIVAESGALLALQNATATATEP